MNKCCENIADMYNRALNFALDELEDSYETVEFLRAWREGDWDYCKQCNFIGPFPE